MTTPVIAASSGGGRDTEISVGVVCAVLLMCATPGICYYIRKRRIRARPGQKTTDIEHGSRNGSLATLEGILETRSSPKHDEVVSLDRRSSASSVTRRSDASDSISSLQTHTSSHDPSLEIVHGVRTDHDSQLSRPRFVHFKLPLAEIRSQSSRQGPRRSDIMEPLVVKSNGGAIESAVIAGIPFQEI